jgi:hypothetical protein
VFRVIVIVRSSERLWLRAGRRTPRDDQHFISGIVARQENKAVARETLYLVQAFKPGKGARLSADAAIRCKSSDGARRTAEGLALTRAGVVAFSTSGDAELGEYDDEPTIIFRTGRLPAPFQDG